jgi:hypothetical protein
VCHDLSLNEDKILFIQKNAPFVSVIILNFNGESCLEKCLSSVLRTEYSNFEVIFVDNASTDSSLSLVEEAFGNDQRLRIFRNNENLGFSAGNNVGFGYSKGHYIVFLNNDTIVDPYWLAYLVDAMEKDQTIGLAQSMILTINSNEVQTAGWLFSDYLVFQRAIGEGEASDIKFLPTFEVSFACGAAMIISRELVEEIGLFDSKIPFYYDDTLLSFKTWLADKRVVTVSKSKIRHVGGATKPWNIYFMTFQGLRAKILLIFDVYFNLDDLVKALFIFIHSIFVGLLFLVKRKNRAGFSAYIHALGWTLRNFEYVWKNRLEHWSKAKISPKKLLAKFIRINLPISLYMMPYRIRSALCNLEVTKYEEDALVQNLK